nr:MAG TPA: hypothetical protein [Crassvirales sp.]
MLLLHSSSMREGAYVPSYLFCSLQLKHYFIIHTPNG